MGRKAVLPALPDAEPSSLPAPLRRGSKWQLHPETGQIVSSYYDRRYTVHIDASSRQKLDAMHEGASASEARRQEQQRWASDGT